MTHFDELQKKVKIIIVTCLIFLKNIKPFDETCLAIMSQKVLNFLCYENKPTNTIETDYRFQQVMSETLTLKLYE